MLHRKKELLLTELKYLENDNYRVYLAKTAYGSNPLDTLASSSTDWKTTLSSVKGVYLLTDIKEGEHYVESAYGEDGQVIYILLYWWK